MNSKDFRNDLKQLKSPFFEVIVLSACIVLLFIIYFNKGIFPELFNGAFLKLFVFISILVSTSIIIMSLYTYPIIKNYRMIMAGFIFIAIDLFDWPYILNFTAMNFDYTTNANISILLWIVPGMISAIGFAVLFSLNHKPQKELNNRISLTVLAILIFVILVLRCIFNTNVRPMVINQTHGLTMLGTITVAIILILSLYTLYRIYKEYYKTNYFIYKRLFSSFLLMLFSNTAIMNISSIHDSWHILSYVYKIISYIIILNLYYKYGIQRPHSQLSQAKEELNSYIAQLDKQVEKRTLELRAINEKLLADQEIARRMQIAMLPEIMPKNDYAAFSASYVPAENLSGDFYNVFRIDDNRFGVCIGDVSGHGVSAAMLSIFIFQKLQSLMEEEGGEGMAIPSVVLTHLYESLNSANFDENMYVVMVYGVFNTDTGIFSYASGGLNTIPLRVRPDGSIQELNNDGFAICKLGDFYKPKFVNHQILLFPNDKLILYTDGLVDARNPENQEYSLSRLKQIIRDQYKWGVDYLSKAITQDVQAFICQKATDDITLLILDVLPPFSN